MESFTSMVSKSFSNKNKCVEPEPRMVGGRFGYAFHRFQIKGGISLVEVMAKNICANNTLLARLVDRSKHSVSK